MRQRRTNGLSPSDVVLVSRREEDDRMAHLISRLRPTSAPNSQKWLAVLGILGFSGFQNPLGFLFFGFFLFLLQPARPTDEG